MGLFDKKDLKKGPNYSKTRGATGTEIYGGYLDVEYLGQLTDIRRRFDIYHEMRTSSPTLHMCILAVSASVLGAKWRFRVKEEFEGNSAAERQLEFFERAFDHDMLLALVRDMLTSIIYGFYLGERYYVPYSFEGKDFWAPRARFLSQRTIEQWHIDEGTGKWLAAVQRAYGDTAKDPGVTIAAENLIHYAVDKEGDNFYGISMLRACYGNYVRKNANFKNIAVGNRILSIPFLAAVQLTPDMVGILTDEDVDKVVELLNQRLSGEKYRSNIVMPPGMDLKDVGTSFDPDKLYSCNDREDHEMARNFLASFLMLAGGAKGSFALSKDLSSFFLQSLEAKARGIEMAINKGLIAPTSALNFGEGQMVEATHSEIGGKAGVELANAMSTLAQSGMIIPDNPTEQWARKKYGMPDMEDPQAQRPQQQGPQSPFGQPEDGPPTSPKEGKKAPAEDDEEDGSKQMAIELSNRRAQNALANRTARRINRLKRDLQETIALEIGEIIRAKQKKIVKYAKEGRIPSAEDIQTSTAKAVKEVSKLVTASAIEQMEDVSKKVELAYDISPARLRSTIKHLCSAEVAAMVAQLDNATLYSMLQAMGSLGNPEQIAAVVSDAALTTVESKLSKSKTTVLPAKIINMASEVAYQEAGHDEIESYTYYNSSPVAAICQYIAGKTLKPLDAERYQPPFHFNCTTVKLANLKSFRGNPKSVTPAPSAKAVKSIQLEDDCCG